MARYSSRISQRHMVAVRFSALGDVALTTGVLLRYHCQYGTFFTVVTRKLFAPLFDGNPAIDGVVALDDSQLHGTAQRAAFRSIVERWQDSPLLDLHRNLRSALLAKSWRDAILGYKKMTLERRLFLWSKKRLFRSTLLALNVPQRYACALWPADALPPPEELRPRVFMTSEETAWAQSVLQPLRDEYRHIAALHPFATHPLKTWSPKNWIALAHMLKALGIGCLWVGIGDPAAFADLGLSFISKTSVRQTCALLASADILVTGDSAPMHLAAAVDTPVLAFFGPTTREWGFFPAGHHDAVLELDMPCRPCSLHGSGSCPNSHACLEGITASAAANRIMDMLGR